MTKSEEADLAILLAERAKPRSVGKLGALMGPIPVNDLGAYAGTVLPGFWLRIHEIMATSVQSDVDAMALGAMGFGA